MKRGIVAVVVAVVGLACTAAPALAGCKVGVFAELPVTMSGLKPMVTAKIDGRDARFMADSGAFYSLITPGSAAEYGLKLGAAPYGMRIEGVGGVADVSVATVKTFTLANVPIPHVQFLVGGSETGGVGVLGQNVLGLADVEYDLAGGAIRLMKPKDCGQRILAYWAGTKAIGEVDVSPSTPYDPHTLGPVYLNGVKLRAMFDTGAGTSVVSLEAAARAGIKPGGSGVTPAGETGGLGRRLVKTWIAHVDSFKIDDEEIHNTQLFVSDLGLDGADMLLGADFFLAHRVYVANSQHKLYFTYNGGPVFRLDGAVMAQEG
ncbi:MAG TPA: retropepsin-like aspartic protease, partial [Caulobacteraceae bacterium]